MNSWLKVLVVTTALATSTAHAISYTEVADVGESLSDAQAIGSGVDVIYGHANRDSADLFSFYWSGGAFAVDTFGSHVDTQLFLFNAAGQGVWANDEAGFIGVSKIVDPALGAGQYFIGISLFDYDPFSSAGVIFPSAPFSGQYGPLNNSPLDHWAFLSQHGSLGGDYIVNFNTATAVPEPRTLALFGLALAVLGFATRRRRV